MKTSFNFKSFFSFLLFILFFGLLIFLLRNAPEAFASELRPWLDQPTSIEDISCGRYVVGAKLKIGPDGRDILLLYPETDREFEVPILKLKAEESLRMEGVYGLYEVEYPLDQGKNQGFFHFRKMVDQASAEKTYRSAIKKLDSPCISI